MEVGEHRKLRRVTMFNFGVNHYGAMDPHNKKGSREQKRRKLKVIGKNSLPCSNLPQNYRREIPKGFSTQPPILQEQATATSP